MSLFAGAITRLSAFFGSGIGPIFLDDVGCSGTESRLIDCPNSGIGMSNCGHRDDAGVICQPTLTTSPSCKQFFINPV